MREFITRLLPSDVKSRLKGLLHIPDIGADHGDWSPSLRTMASDLGGVTIAQTLLGARATAVVPFSVSEFSGISSVLREQALAKRWK
jgi:hypothetical protein